MMLRLRKVREVLRNIQQVLLRKILQKRMMLPLEAQEEVGSEDMQGWEKNA